MAFVQLIRFIKVLSLVLSVLTQAGHTEFIKHALIFIQSKSTKARNTRALITRTECITQLTDETMTIVTSFSKERQLSVF